MTTRWTEVIAPQLGVNDELIIVAEWCVRPGTKIITGQKIAILETSKVAFELQSETSGYIYPVVGSGEEVPIQTTIAVITSEADSSTVNRYLERMSTKKTPAGSATGAGLPEGLHLTQKARELVQKLDLNLDVLPRDRILREQDILALSKGSDRLGEGEKDPSSTVALHSAGSFVQQTGVSPIEVIPSHDLSWVCEARATLAELSPDNDKLVMNIYSKLPIEERSEVYRDNGVCISGGGRLGIGAVIRAKRLYIGPDAQIGDHCYIEADSIYLGAATKIGNHAHIVTGELILREGVVIADQVVVDLAGGRSRESRLLVGAASLISSRVLINTAREVVLENESALSPGVMLFTHSFWQSVLEGYSVAFSGLRVCENAWLGAGCQVLPGVKIGAGAVVMSNSTVISDVPPFSLVGGVPSKIIRRHIRRKLDQSQQARILRNVLNNFFDHLEFKGCKVERAQNKDRVLITLRDGRARMLVLVASEHFPVMNLPTDSIVISLGQDVSVADQASVFYVAKQEFVGVEDKLTHELRNFLRRHGIRFRPFAWNPSFTKEL